MTEKQYDEILKAGLMLFKERQLCSVPSEKEINYQFSNRFKKKMGKLIRNHESYLWLYMQKTSRKVAVFILAILLSFTASLSIKAVRDAVFDFFYKVFSDHTYIDQQSFVNTEMTEYYVIPYLPQEFKETDFTTINISGADFFWRSNTGEEIIFSQTKSSFGGTFNSEGGEVKEITVNEITVLYCDNGNDIFCTWNEKGLFLQMVYPSYLGEEYIHKIAGKLEKTEPVPLS